MLKLYLSDQVPDEVVMFVARRGPDTVLVLNADHYDRVTPQERIDLVNDLLLRIAATPPTHALPTSSLRLVS